MCSSEDPTPEYKIDELNAMGDLYGGGYPVFVEGSSDIPFWKARFPENGFVIIGVGGCDTLDHRIRLIRNFSTCRFIVCRDCDYNILHPEWFVDHALIIYTVGHSIETMMYCPNNLNVVTQRLSKDCSSHTEEIQFKLDNFCICTMPLLVIDTINYSERYKGRYTTQNMVSLLQDKSDRFHNNGNALTGEIEKVANGEMPKYPSEVVSEISESITNSGIPIRLLTRGHFLEGISRSLVQNYYKKSINKDMFNTLLVDCLPRNCKDTCLCHQEIQKRISRALTYLQEVDNN